MARAGRPALKYALFLVWFHLRLCVLLSFAALELLGDYSEASRLQVIAQQYINHHEEAEAGECDFLQLLRCLCSMIGGCALLMRVSSAGTSSSASQVQDAISTIEEVHISHLAENGFFAACCRLPFFAASDFPSHVPPFPPLGWDCVVLQKCSWLDQFQDTLIVPSLLLVRYSLLGRICVLRGFRLLDRRLQFDEVLLQCCIFAIYSCVLGLCGVHVMVNFGCGLLSARC